MSLPSRTSYNGSNAAIPEMTYRFLGDSGLLVSKLGPGTFMSDESDFWYNLMTLVYKDGVNFFDCAEAYGEGMAELMLGKAIEEGIMEGPECRGLNRKHVIEGTKASLKRLELDYVDVIFCHRSDPHTPIEETVRAMNFVIEQGWAFYWGTSSWSSADIIEACEIADRLGLIRPVAEQPQYNILERSQVDFELVHLYKKYKLGLTTWSPLSMGILTGKYSAGKPEGSHYTSPAFQSGWMACALLRSWGALWRRCRLPGLCRTRTCPPSSWELVSRPEQLEETLKAINVNHAGD